MKNTKKPAKKDKPKTKAQAPRGKAAPGKELTDDQLEHVAGGAFDTYLKIDDAQTTGATDYKLALKI